MSDLSDQKVIFHLYGNACLIRRMHTIVM